MYLENDKFICEIKISDDYYSAEMTLVINTKDTSNIYEIVMMFIKNNNILYGVKEAEIKAICDSGQSVTNFIIAEGVHHKHGENAYLTMMVETSGLVKPKLNEDGSVNFKEMDFAHIVPVGEVLQVKTPATLGTDGITVTNKVIASRPGKDLPIKPGENTILSEDGLSIIANAEGKVKLMNGRISIIRQIDIDTVGPETGNIYFNGDVHVRNNVLDGYTVNCDGDLTVDGLIEGSILKVKGDLTVGKGIVGHGESDIVVNGKLVTHFIENANVYVKGEIETGEIINSCVLCDSQIMVKGKKGLIIGGEITSKSMIEANQIGSKFGVLTSINLGIDVSAIMELKQLKESLQDLKIVIMKLKASKAALEIRIQENPYDDALTEKLAQYKDSLLSTEILSEEQLKRYNELMDALKNINNGRIKINTVYPDTVVKIGNSKYFIDSALKDCILTRVNDEVIMIGF